MLNFRENPFLRAALLTFLVPGVCSIPSLPFLIWGKQVEGTVIAMNYHPSIRFIKGSSQAYWSRVIQFSTENGEVLEFDTQDNRVFVGDRVGVYYLTGTSWARLATFNELWWLPVYALCIQVVLLILIGMLALAFRQNSRLNRLVPLCFPLIFMFIGGISAYPGFQRAQILSRGVQTTGVIALEPVYAPKGKLYPVIQFVAVDGKTYKTESQSNNKGAKVNVIYLPESPRDALVLTQGEVVNSQQWWVLPLVFIGFPTFLGLALSALPWLLNPKEHK
jgi:hypothetical protein